jgi:hypothetical protein
MTDRDQRNDLEAPSASESLGLSEATSMVAIEADCAFFGAGAGSTRALTVGPIRERTVLHRGPRLVVADKMIAARWPRRHRHRYHTRN